MPRLFPFTRCDVHDSAGHLNAYMAGVIESRHPANDSSGWKTDIRPLPPR